MLAKLALRNTRKSVGDFTVYFLTLSFGVAAFYAFGSVESQGAMASLGSNLKVENLRSLGTTMDVMSVLVSIVLAFLVFYANGFLIRRRKREFGTYLLLGMPKRQVASVLVMETMIVGGIALGAGLLAGLVASQGLSLLTASMFELDMMKFQLVFSATSLIKTVVFFGLLFVVVSALNLLGLSRHTISRLLNASKRREARVRSPWLAAILAVSGLILVTASFWMLLQSGLVTSLETGRIWFQIGAGVLGTFMLFAGGSGLALRVAQWSRRGYLRGLNPFVVRQLDSKVSSTYATMSVVCITLFFAMTILSGGIGFGNVLNRRTSTAYDASFIRFGSEEASQTILQGIKGKGFDVATYFDAWHELPVYESGLVLRVDGSGQPLRKGLPGMDVQMIAQSDANTLLRLQGKTPIDVGADGFALAFALPRPEDAALRSMYADATPRVGGKELHAISGGLLDLPTSAGSTLLPVMVVPDNVVKGATLNQTTLNVIYRGDGEAAEMAVLAAGLLETGHEDPTRPFDVAASSRMVNGEALAERVTVTFIGLYVGLVLLVTGVSILALQQLSEATDNRDRYTALSRIGASRKLMSRAVFTQVAVYFAAPVGLALIYSLVGGKAVLDTIRRVGDFDVTTEYRITSALLVVFFFGYFITTVITAQRMALERHRAPAG